MLKPELRYTFDMSSLPGQHRSYWALLEKNDDEKDEEDDEEGQSRSEEDDAYSDSDLGSTTRFEETLPPDTAVPKANRHVEEEVVMEQVRQHVWGQLQKRPSKVMSSRLQPREGSYSRQQDMPDLFQKKAEHRRPISEEPSTAGR